MEFTLGYLTIAHAPLVDVIAATKFAGFAGCGMRITGRAPNDGSQTLVGNPALTKEIARVLDDTGVRLNSVSTYNFTPEMKLADYDPVFDIGASLGVKLFNILCHDPDESRFVDTLAGYSAAAAKVGARAMIEFMPYSQAKTIEQAVRMIRASGAPNLGLELDSLHLHRSGGNARAIKAVDPKLIFHVQICDAPATLQPGMTLAEESRTARRLPGTGGLPLMEFLDALPADLASIECEAPHPPHKHLPTNEQARLAYQATVAFVDAWRARGRKPV